MPPRVLGGFPGVKPRQEANPGRRETKEDGLAATTEAVVSQGRVGSAVAWGGLTGRDLG